MESEVLRSRAEKRMELIRLKRVESAAPPAEKPVSTFESFVAKLAKETQFADKLDAVAHVPARPRTLE